MNKDNNNLYIQVIIFLIRDTFSELTSAPFFSEKNNLSFIETSALDSTNVEEAFKNILTGWDFRYCNNLL